MNFQVVPPTPPLAPSVKVELHFLLFAFMWQVYFSFTHILRAYLLGSQIYIMGFLLDASFVLYLLYYSGFSREIESAIHTEIYKERWWEAAHIHYYGDPHVQCSVCKLENPSSAFCSTGAGPSELNNAYQHWWEWTSFTPDSWQHIQMLIQKHSHRNPQK